MVTDRQIEEFQQMQPLLNKNPVTKYAYFESPLDRVMKWTEEQIADIQAKISVKKLEIGELEKQVISFQMCLDEQEKAKKEQQNLPHPRTQGIPNFYDQAKPIL